MSKVSTLARFGRELFVAMMLVAFVTLTSGCKHHAHTPPPPPSGGTPPPVVPPPAAIEGVATPTSVAVVTATNAQ
jgi:hypothetical protein